MTASSHFTLTTLAVMWCSDPRFWRWAKVNSMAEARDFIRQKCGIKSRRELDTNEAAQKAFHEHIRVPYSAYLDVDPNG